MHIYNGYLSLDKIWYAYVSFNSSKNPKQHLVMKAKVVLVVLNASLEFHVTLSNFNFFRGRLRRENLIQIVTIIIMMAWDRVREIDLWCFSFVSYGMFFSVVFCCLCLGSSAVQILLQKLGVRRYPMFIITPGGGSVGEGTGMLRVY